MRQLTIALLTSAFAATLWGGCLKKSVFNCATNESCGAGGQCETETGFCSIGDTACASGRRYSDTAGSGFEGQCVGGGTPTDGPVDPDGPPPDDGLPPDGMGPKCDGYAAIAGGETGHLYLFINTQRNHSDSHNVSCKATNGAYLAIPNAAGELGAYDTLTGGVDAWVGFDEPGAEDTFVDILGNAFDIGTAGITIVDNKMNDDCALMVSATGVDMQPCANTERAVCECEP